MNDNRDKPVLPAAIESLIEGLVDPQKNRFLKESHLMMIERCISALQDAVLKYKLGNKSNKR